MTLVLFYPDEKQESWGRNIHFPLLRSLIPTIHLVCDTVSSPPPPLSLSLCSKHVSLGQIVEGQERGNEKLKGREDGENVGSERVG